MTLLATTGPWPCPLCGKEMYAWMGRKLHLHHSSADSKLAGLPGDQLAHAWCNMRDGGQLGASVTNRNGREPSKPRPQSRDW